MHHNQIFFFKSSQIYTKYAEYGETNEKLIFIFLLFRYFDPGSKSKWVALHITQIEVKLTISEISLTLVQLIL